MFKVGDKVKIVLDLSFLNPLFVKIYQEVGYATIYYIHGNCVNVEARNKNGDISFDGFTKRHVAHFDIDSNTPLDRRIQLFLERERFV